MESRGPGARTVHAISKIAHAHGSGPIALLACPVAGCVRGTACPLLCAHAWNRPLAANNLWKRSLLYLTLMNYAAMRFSWRFFLMTLRRQREQNINRMGYLVLRKCPPYHGNMDLEMRTRWASGWGSCRCYVPFMLG